MSSRSTKENFNQEPLAVREGQYLGREIPQSSTQGESIILEPLTKLYYQVSHKKKDIVQLTTPIVKIFIYNSGIVIKQEWKSKRNIVDWYPIQNLYCSAGLKPDKNKKGEVVFRQFNEPTRLAKRPIFSFVVREPGKDGRRVLMCHSFLIDHVSAAQELVHACQYAYTNKAGWNNPISDKRFLDAKMSYTMQMVDEEVSLKKLKLETEERDKQLAKQPKVKEKETLPNQSDLSKNKILGKQQATKKASKYVSSSTTGVTKHIPESKTSFRHPQHSFRQSGPEYQSPRLVMKRDQYPISHSAPVTPRMVVMAPKPEEFTMNSRSNSVIMQQPFHKVPTHQAASYYKGFTSNAMSESNGVYSIAKPPSAAGQLLSQSFTSGLTSTPEPVLFDHHLKSATRVSKQSRRNHYADYRSSKGHKVLASSEPYEVVNGFSAAEGPTVIDWNDAAEDLVSPVELDSSTPYARMNGSGTPSGKKAKSSKHHRLSRKQMEEYSHQNGNSADESGIKVSSRLF